MMSITETFGAMLKRLRIEAGRSLRDLGHQADIPYSTIAVIESGRQSVTIELAERLADALEIEDRDSFLMKAVSTTKRERILPFARGYRAEILNGLAIYLAHAGIAVEDIAGCYFARPPYNESDVDGKFVSQVMEQVKRRNSHQVHVVRDGGSLPGPGLVIQMKGGRRLVLTVEARALR